MGFGSYVAACAEVSVSPAGELTVHRIVAATDCGHAVNPQQIEAQVEGSFAYGLSAALLGECTLEKGRFMQSNFDSYPALLMAQMPKVETIVMPSGGFLGRRGRAHHRSGRAGGAERDLRRHRPAHPQPADQEPAAETRMNLPTFLTPAVLAVLTWGPRWPNPTPAAARPSLPNRRRTHPSGWPPRSNWWRWRG